MFFVYLPDFYLVKNKNKIGVVLFFGPRMGIRNPRAGVQCLQTGIAGECFVLCTDAEASLLLAGRNRYEIPNVLFIKLPWMMLHDRPSRIVSQ